MSEIVSVDGLIFFNIEFAWFRLRTPSKFGTKIVFIPKFRLFMFSKHPIVDELKRICKLSY